MRVILTPAGPDKPPGVAIDNFSRLLVDDLCSWSGARTISTALRPGGIEVTVAGSFFVMDRPASASFEGGSSHTRTWNCDRCPPQGTKAKPSPSLTPSTIAEHTRTTEIAARLASAGKRTDADLGEVIAKHGLRRTPLTDLPNYWYMECSGIEPFHLFYENCVSRHWRDKRVFGADGDVSNGADAPPFARREVDEFRRIVSATMTPRHITRLPGYVGSRGGGTLKGDQLRHLAITFSPVAFPHVLDGPNSTSKQRAWLANWFELVSGIRLAAAVDPGPADLDRAQQHFDSYVQGLATLFGPAGVSPSHHRLACHLIQCIRRLGPVMSWHSEPFESIDGKLKKINVNGKIGEIQRTLHRAVAEQASFASLISRREGVDEDEVSFYESLTPDIVAGSSSVDVAGLYNEHPTPLATQDLARRLTALDWDAVHAVTDHEYELLRQRINDELPRHSQYADIRADAPERARTRYLPDTVVNLQAAPSPSGGIFSPFDIGGEASGQVLVLDDFWLRPRPGTLVKLWAHRVDRNSPPSVFALVALRKPAALGRPDRYAAWPALRTATFSETFEDPHVGHLVFPLRSLISHYSFGPAIEPGHVVCVSAERSIAGPAFFG